MADRWQDRRDAVYRFEVLATSARLECEAAELVARARALLATIDLERSDRSWRRSSTGRRVGRGVSNARTCDFPSI